MRLPEDIDRTAIIGPVASGKLTLTIELILRAGCPVTIVDCASLRPPIDPDIPPGTVVVLDGPGRASSDAIPFLQDVVRDRTVVFVASGREDGSWWDLLVRDVVLAQGKPREGQGDKA